MNERGITPVISVVLLLMMTVAIAGIAWFWLQGMTERIMNATEETTDVQFGKLLFDLDFGSTKVYCTDDDYIDMVSVFVSVDGGTGVQLDGVLLNDLVVENDDLINLQIGDYLGTGEYKEIIINNHGKQAKYTGDMKTKGDEADLAIEIKTNRGRETATMTFNPSAGNSVGCN